MIMIEDNGGFVSLLLLLFLLLLFQIKISPLHVFYWLNINSQVIFSGQEMCFCCMNNILPNTPES